MTPRISLILAVGILATGVLYYGADYSKERLEAWLTYGSPADCIAHLQQFKDCGCQRVTFRISTMGDPMAQFRRVVEEVLPFV